LAVASKEMAAAAEAAAEDHTQLVPEVAVSVRLVVIRFSISRDNHVIN
jgi:hypothetical protein